MRRVELLTANSNQAAVEILASRCRSLASGDPFGRRPVIVDNHAIGQNVVAHVAARAGMAVGLDPVLLPQFLHQIAGAVEASSGPPVPGIADRPIAHQVVALAILEVIPDLERNGSPESRRIASNIGSEKDITTKLALATELARSFDAAVQSSLNDTGLEPWVAELRAALKAHAAGMQPAELGRRLQEYVDRWPRVLQQLDRLASDAALRLKLCQRGVLPLHVFGFDLTVSPCTPQARGLELLAKSSDITLILVDPVLSTPLNPPAKAWGARSRRPVIAARRAIGTHTSGLEQSEGSEGDGLEADDDRNIALAAVQRSVAGLTLPQGPYSPDDGSLTIHHVASDARAAEVVRDAIHHAFSGLPNLLPEQVVVVSDDPRRDVPFLETAFEACAAGEQLPCTLTGDSTRDRDSGIDAFLTALRLAPTSFARDAVFRLVSMPSVAEALRLDPEKLETLARACETAGLRSYIDSHHRERVIGVPGQADDCTWTAAFRSLTASLAVPDGGHAVVTSAGIVPAGGMSATEMHVLSAMAQILRLLRELHALAEGGDIGDMLERCRRIADGLFARPGKWMRSRAAVVAAIDAVGQDALAAGYSGEVGLFWLVGELTRRLDRPSFKSRALHGGISLLKPAQARGRAPRVTVFLLSERFPTEDRPLWPSPFALEDPGRPMQQHSDLRDVFSVFMNTSERVVFVVPSMCGRTRERLSMSSVVHDIRAVAESLAVHGVIFTERDESVVAHSLSAIESPIATRHRGAIRGVQALCQARAKGPVAQVFGVPDPSCEVPTEISLDRFLRFFSKPIDVFLDHREASVRDVADDWKVREKIHPDGLDRWQLWTSIYQAAVAARGRGAPLSDEDVARIRALFRAAGVLRTDKPGDDYLGANRQAPCDVERAISPVASRGATQIDIRVAYKIHGKEHELRIHGSALIDGQIAVHHVLGAVRPRHVLEMAALEAVCRFQGAAGSWRIHHIDSNQLATTLSTSPTNFVGRASATPIPLAVLVRIWHLGHQMPLPIFAEAIRKSLPDVIGGPYDLRAAASAYYAADYGRGGGQALEVKPRIAFRGQEPISASRFNVPAGMPESDFERLAAFFSGSLPDPFCML